MNETESSVTVDSVKKIEIVDNSKRAQALIIVFWLLIGLTVIAIFSRYFELELLKGIQQGGFIDESVANANDLRQMVVGLLQTGVFITSVVVFLNWFRRAYGNLHRLGISYLKFKESMAVWSWFIPIIVLFRPAQIMSEIWTETQERIKKLDSSYAIKNGNLIIASWWILFIISNFIGRYFLQTMFEENSIQQLIESAQVFIISDILQVAEALLVILMVSQLSKMESKLAEELKQSGGSIVYK